MTMKDDTEPKKPTTITPAQRERFARGQAKKAQIQVITKDGKHVVNHASMMDLAVDGAARGKDTFTLDEIIDDLGVKSSAHGPVKTLLQELWYIGAIVRDGKGYTFLRRRWPVPAWSRFRLTDEVIVGRKARASAAKASRGQQRNRAMATLRMPALVIRANLGVLLVLAILSGLTLLIIFSSSPAGTIATNVTTNTFIAFVVITPVVVFCIVAPLLAVKVLHALYLSRRTTSASRHPSTRRVEDAVPAVEGLHERESSPEADEGDASDVMDVAADEVPTPPSGLSSGVYGETAAMGNPIPVLAAKLGCAGEPITEEEATAADGTIFCSLVFKLHEGTTDDVASQLVAALVPAGCVPDDRAIAELAARGASRSSTLPGVDARMEAAGVKDKPSPAASMRVYADPSLLDYETLLVPAPTIDDRWYAVPASRLRGGIVALHKVVSVYHAEPVRREKADIRHVGDLPPSKDELRVLGKGEGKGGWKERFARGNIAAALFEQDAREKAAGIKPSTIEHDPGKLDVALSGFPTWLTKDSVSTRMKRGIPVTLRCSICGAGPGDVPSLGILDAESAREAGRAFMAAVAALCPACMDKHGIRVVEDTLPRDPMATYRFLRDHDELGKHPWPFEALAKELGALSDRAKRRLSEHVDYLEKGHKIHVVKGSGYAFTRGGIKVSYEGQSRAKPCTECGVNEEIKSGSSWGGTRIRIPTDTAVVLARIKGSAVATEMCEACARKFDVVTFGFERVSVG